MKLIVDMNLSPRWVERLSVAGVESAHWSTLGPSDISDAEIMSYALRSGYIVLTHDLDFGAILANTQGNGPSVIQIRAEEVSPDIIGDQVVSALKQMQSELEQGALLTVDPVRTRLRLLPLRRGQ